MLAPFIWAVELFLESTGQNLAFKQRTPSLGFYLAFRALSDIVLMLVRSYSNDATYANAYWVQQLGSAVLLCWVCVEVVSRMLGDLPRYDHILVISAFGMIACVIGFSNGPDMAAHVIGSAFYFDVFLGMIMIVGLLTRNRHLNRQWTLIGWAACIHIGSQGIIHRIATHHESALLWLPIGVIPALIVWNASVWRKMAIRIEFAK